jgi:hypothetical protein
MRWRGLVESIPVRWSSGLLASVAMVGAVTVIVLLERHVPLLSLLALYLTYLRFSRLRSSGAPGWRR